MKFCPSCGHENPDDAVVCRDHECRYDFEFPNRGTDFPPGDRVGFSPGNLIAGQYQVVRPLGQGGMGVVYLVKNTHLRDRDEALKVIHPHLVSHPEALKRFEDEVIICQEFSDKRIVKVYNYQRWEDVRFFTMEYCKGSSLRGWMLKRRDQKPPFSLFETQLIIDPLLKALSTAHRKTVHRDIKPENIMVLGQFPDVKIKVLDFGIAKGMTPSQFSQTAHALGTPFYMAPEQIKRLEKIDHRADIFSVGMLIYEMLIGELAVGRFSLPGESGLDLPEELDQVIEKALTPNAEDRFGSADDMRKGLLNAVNIHERVLEERRAEEERRLQTEIESLFAKGQSLVENRQWRDAEEIFNRIVALDPEHEASAALIEEVRNKKATLKELQDNAEKLTKLLKQTEAAEKEGSLEKAISLLDQAIPLSRDEASLKERKASIENVLEKERKARHDTEIIGLMNKTELLLESRKWSQAEEVLLKVLTLDRDHEKAKAILREVRITNERLKQLLKEIGDAEKRGDYETAITAVEAAVQLSGEGKALEEIKDLLKKTLQEEREQIEQQKKADEERKRRETAEEEKKKALEKEREENRRKETEREEAERRAKLIRKKRKRVIAACVLVGCLVVLIGVLVFWVGENRTWEDKYVGPKFTNDLGMKFVYIKPGNFMMGSPSDEPERNSDEIQHRVNLSKGFYLQTTEVTQGQWKAVMGSNPSNFQKCGDDCPVESVSWNDCQKFIKKLNRMQKKHRYRLPTEAEWEYACRAGTTTPFSFGRCLGTDQANYDGNHPLTGCSKGTYRQKTLPVGSFSPNAWGLYDMHGNVWEWVEDWFGEYPSGSVTDPDGYSSGSYRVFRGGSWSIIAWFCRSANRGNDAPGSRRRYLGFRLACGAVAE